MKKFEITGVYEATGDSDLTEGRGPPRHIGYFTHEADARQVVKGEGAMGSTGYVKRMDLRIEVYESLAEFEAGRQRSIREQALAKLTKEERKALGLT